MLSHLRELPRGLGNTPLSTAITTGAVGSPTITPTGITDTARRPMPFPQLTQGTEPPKAVAIMVTKRVTIAASRGNPV